jgi:enterochelin esterase-like enzyme
MEFIKRIEEVAPESELFNECDQKGTVERVDYHTTNFDGKPMDKHAYIYLPYNYDPNKAYDILYYIHGGGETAEKYIFQDGEENKLKRAVDNMIKEKTIRPLIIVTPSPYPYHEITRDIDSRLFTSYFHNELCLDLMPLVEGKYHTFADFKTSEEDLKAARDHRVVMGWSMGCGTTWDIFLNRIAYFRYFGFTSGHCNDVDGEKTKEWADATAEFILKKVTEQGFTKKDFKCIELTGTLDIAFENVSLLLSALRAYPDMFDFESEEKNFRYLTWPKGEHHTKWRLQYAINVIKQYFGK